MPESEVRWALGGTFCPLLTARGRRPTQISPIPWSNFGYTFSKQVKSQQPPFLLLMELSSGTTSTTFNLLLFSWPAYCPRKDQGWTDLQFEITETQPMILRLIRERVQVASHSSGVFLCLSPLKWPANSLILLSFLRCSSCCYINLWTLWPQTY